tara:strand:- start:1556 stop:1771 length:216 start_codon:yes stop_codon:yes gene_type:complete
MNDKKKHDSWIHIEKFNQTHSWRQTWIFLGATIAVFAFALLYKIDNDQRCKPAQAFSDSSQSIPFRMQPEI